MRKIGVVAGFKTIIVVIQLTNYSMYFFVFYDASIFGSGI